MAAASFAFDMNKVFEDFLTRALEDSLRHRSGWLRPQFPTHLAEGRRLTVEPDITWWLRGAAGRLSTPSTRRSPMS